MPKELQEALADYQEALMNNINASSVLTKATETKKQTYNALMLANKNLQSLVRELTDNGY
jgi:hypothetical protein